VRKVRVGKWRIVDGKVESGLMSDLESSVVALTYVDQGPHRIGPCGTIIDYVVTHMRFMGSHKLNSFDDR
jgi:hypothetical protein